MICRPGRGVAEYSKDFVEVLAEYLRSTPVSTYVLHFCFSLSSHASALAYARTPRGKLARVTLAYLPIHALPSRSPRTPAPRTRAPLADPGGP